MVGVDAGVGDEPFAEQRKARGCGDALCATGRLEDRPHALAALAARLAAMDAAIEAELTEEESARVRAAIRGMNPAELAAWRLKIEAVPPKKAAALVRAELEDGVKRIRRAPVDP